MRKIIRRKTIIIRTITGRNISRPYVNKRNRLILGQEKKNKKQRGGFFAPIAAALVPVAIDLVSKIFR